MSLSADDTVGIIGLAMVLLRDAIAALRTILLRRASRSWPQVAGKFLSGRARKINGGRWVAEIAYSFATIGGEYYGGILRHRTSNEEMADEYIRHRKDAQVLVRYRPSNPDTSFATLV
ncbi:MAG: DUF3592 domain-containing protein [Bryobacteraceae bacterium]